MLLILQVAAGCFIALLAYQFLIGFPGLSDAQIKELGNRLEEIIERLPDSDDVSDSE